MPMSSGIVLSMHITSAHDGSPYRPSDWIVFHSKKGDWIVCSLDPLDINVGRDRFWPFCGFGA